MKRVIDLNLLFCWRPRRDLNPCYRRESVALNRNPNERLRIRMHRKESQQLQRTAFLLRRCPQGLNPIVAAATRDPAERYCLPHKAL
jgi:hypothetical protein